MVIRNTDMHKATQVVTIPDAKPSTTIMLIELWPCDSGVSYKACFSENTSYPKRYQRVSSFCQSQRDKHTGPHVACDVTGHWYTVNSIICPLLLISMLWHRQTIFESKGDKLSYSVHTSWHYWSLVRGIHRSPVDAPHQGPVMRTSDVLFDFRWHKP